MKAFNIVLERYERRGLLKRKRHKTEKDHVGFCFKFCAIDLVLKEAKLRNKRRRQRN